MILQPFNRLKSGAVDTVANSNLGNGNLRPETFGRTRQELPLRIAGPPTETDPWRGKLRKCRAILWRRKSRRFARTTWWRTQSCGTGLRRTISLLTGKTTGKSYGT